MWAFIRRTIVQAINLIPAVLVLGSVCGVLYTLYYGMGVMPGVALMITLIITGGIVLLIWDHYNL